MEIINFVLSPKDIAHLKYGPHVCSRQCFYHTNDKRRIHYISFILRHQKSSFDYHNYSARMFLGGFF